MATLVASPSTLLALDTDVFTDWNKQRPHTVNAINDYLDRMDFLPKLTATTVFEVQHGFEALVVKSGGLDQTAQQIRSKAERLIQKCGVPDFNQQAAEIAAYIYVRLAHRYQNKHWRDVYIAATALAHGYGVATRNQSDFELIGQNLPPRSTLYLAVWKP